MKLPTPRRPEGGRTSSPKLRVSVNNRRCHRYGICQLEAESVFRIAEDGRLQFDAHPPVEQHESAKMAARMCPMQAIIVEESTR
jgi:ferredoxin